MFLTNFFSVFEAVVTLCHLGVVLYIVFFVGHLHMQGIENISIILRFENEKKSTDPHAECFLSGTCFVL